MPSLLRAQVFLGAAAVLSNGTVLSRAGTAAVAMMAHAHSKVRFTRACLPASRLHPAPPECSRLALPPAARIPLWRCSVQARADGEHPARGPSQPVMICCETHKFNERVMLDSITHNELGDPEALASLPGRADKSEPLEVSKRHGRLPLRSHVVVS
jgi:translation initiation factor eIF-2B subunit delta